MRESAVFVKKKDADIIIITKKVRAAQARA
jgi:hypothetical protein